MERAAHSCERRAACLLPGPYADWGRHVRCDLAGRHRRRRARRPLCALHPRMAWRKLKPADFHPSQFAAGAKHTCTLDVETNAGVISLPVVLARGAAPGQTLVATAGVHGDEYEGPRTIYETFAGLDPAQMSGSFLAVPVANPPAFWNVSRCNPIDGDNLARAFSGRPGGNPTAAFAYALDQHIIAHADFFIDLHSEGVRYLMPTMAGYYSRDERSRKAAMIFGAPVVWGHDNIAPGRTISACLERGIPFLYTEAPRRRSNSPRRSACVPPRSSKSDEAPRDSSRIAGTRLRAGSSDR